VLLVLGYLPRKSRVKTQAYTSLARRSLPPYTPSRIERIKRRTRKIARAPRRTSASATVPITPIEWLPAKFTCTGSDPFTAPSDPALLPVEHTTERAHALTMDAFAGQYPVHNPIPGAFDPVDWTKPELSSDSFTPRDTSGWTSARHENVELETPTQIPTASPLSTEQLLTDDYIRNRIAMRLTEDQAKPEKPGYVYILQDPARPDMIKIGSAKAVSKRHNQIEQGCQRGVIIVHKSPLIVAEARAEKLCHDELRLFKIPFPCETCVSPSGRPTVHQEWFKMSFSRARQAVDKWAALMIQRPYDEDSCSLKDFWHDRLYCEDRAISHEGRLRSPDEYASIRHEIWQKFTTPRQWEIWHYHQRAAMQQIRSFEFWKRTALPIFLFVSFLFLVEISFGVRMHKIHFSVQILQLVPYFLIRLTGKDSTHPKRPSIENGRRRSSRNSSI
jgi:hypothetical protein